MYALRGRIDGGERIAQYRVLVRFQDAVFRVHHFQSGRAGTDIAKTADGDAGHELHLLLFREMEKPQCQLTGSVADPNQQVSSAAIDHLSKQDLAAGDSPIARLQRTDLRQARSVLIPIGQQKQEILNTMKVQTSEFFFERGTNALKFG